MTPPSHSGPRGDQSMSGSVQMSNDQSNNERFNPLVPELSADLKSEKVEEGYNSLTKLRPQQQIEHITQSDFKSQSIIEPKNMKIGQTTGVPFPVPAEG